MSHTGSARGRFAGVGAVLLGVLAVLLFCVHSPAPAALVPGAVAGAGAGAGEAVAVSVAVADGGYERGTPGCGRGGQDDLGSRPVVPPRGGSGPELLPALYDAHGAGGPWSAADQVVASVTPERGRPPLPGPSPVGLSVLRV
ncbi:MULTISPECIES: hypothetical protein [unclassified Streptomyces]|uniref:hypothetical protein n=1 Tax=unclassified Streptomyces TaxID=2593676 RepID=UPI002E2A2B1B|nr:hypothetical protein [Streptomyces sp. NBC_01429]